MPYTPPSAQSPASSKSPSPAISRTSSYSENGPRSPVSHRPQPPRSNSASYLHKHRRSPSLSDAPAPPSSPYAPDAAVDAVDFARNSSVRQSPPPVNALRIPTGMVISPPDSPDHSDGDDASGRRRGRELEQSWDQLKKAVRAIDQKREGSPAREEGRLPDSASEPVTQITSPSALSTDARRIAHSRSSTETAIIIPRTPSFESPAGTSDDSDDDDHGPLSKPSLVRKKSGELVKPALRPSSRRRYSSMPGTPTYSKSVHFNDSDNQTRHFLQVDKPMAVSAGSSPVETYESETEFPFDGDVAAEPQREVKLANFPDDTFERRARPVRVERIFLSADKQTLVGTVAVQNISFHKLVVARFTLDYWKTTSEIVADYNNDPRSPPSDGCDRFNFHIKLSETANIDTKTLFLCVRYTVNGHDYWDNNDGTNYQVDFTRPAKKVSRPSVTVNGLGARPLNAIPRSRHSPASPRGRPESLDDDFARLDTTSAYHFVTADKLIGESSGSIKLKPRSKRGSIFPTTGDPAAANGLGGRYDFGASLSAALTTAQDKLGRHGGATKATSPAEARDSYFGPLDRTDGPAKTDVRPDALSTDRPAMGSDQYKDLVQKFCYFTPGSGKTPGAPQPAARPAGWKTEGTADTAAAPSSTSPSSAGSHAPSPQLDGSHDRAAPAWPSYFSRSASPAAVTGFHFGDGRAASPISFGYPYHGPTRDGYLSDSHAPTAILG